MKRIRDIIGGAQGLLDIGFELQQCFEESLNDQQKTFLNILRCIEEHIELPEKLYAGTGRRPYQYLPFFRSQLAKNYFQISTNTMLIERLKADPNLRLLCGFIKVPGEATFSRSFSYLATTDIAQNAHDGLTEKTCNGKVVYHNCRDSTAIPARETVERKKREKVKTPENLPKKRGRPRGTVGKRKKPPREMELQINEDPHISLSRFNKKCSIGAKQNSQGNYSYWKGYKLHLDVSDWGYPITACVTGANVQDCLLAIPMEKLTEQKVTFCYSLMDKGYDANAIHEFIKSRDRVPIISLKKRNNGYCPELDPAKEERYKIRTTVERANSHLKDALIPKAIYVKGYTKVSFVLFSAVLCLAALKYLQFLC
jgi:IS5 family transposase